MHPDARRERSSAPAAARALFRRAAHPCGFHRLSSSELGHVAFAPDLPAGAAEFTPGLHTILFGRRGGVRVAIRETRVDLGPGDVVVLRPFETISVSPLPGQRSRIVAIGLPQRLVESLGAPGLGGGCLPPGRALVRVPGRSPLLAHFCRRILDAAGDDKRERAAIGAMLAELARWLPTADLVVPLSRAAATPEVRHVFRLVEAELPPRLHLREIAERFGISPQCLIARFRRHFGTTPQHYLTNRRSARALQAMLYGDIATVAMDMNYSDQAHMTRSFKERFGISPGRLRAGLRGARGA